MLRILPESTRILHDDFSVEHITPKSSGGTDDPENLAMSCQGCNNRKYTALEAINYGNLKSLQHCPSSLGSCGLTLLNLGSGLQMGRSNRSQRGAWRNRIGINPQLEQRGHLRSQRPLEGWGEPCRLGHDFAVCAEGSSVLREVGIAQAGADHAAGIALFLVHSDGAVHAVVDHDHDDVQAVVHGGGQFLAVHQEAAVACEGHNGSFGLVGFGGHRCGYALAHRAVHRGDLAAVRGELQEAVAPGAVVACAVGDDRVTWQAFAQVGEDFSQVEQSGHRAVMQGGFVVGSSLVRPGRPAVRVEWREVACCGGKFGHAGKDGQVRLVDPSQFGGFWEDVNQRLLWRGHVQQAVVVCDHFAQSVADDQQHVGGGDALPQGRVAADPERSEVLEAAVVYGCLALGSWRRLAGCSWEPFWSVCLVTHSLWGGSHFLQKLPDY